MVHPCEIIYMRHEPIYKTDTKDEIKRLRATPTTKV